MAKPIVEVIFKRSLSDILGGCPRVATFGNMKNYTIKQDGTLVVEWDGAKYIYPAHRIKRLKVYYK